MNVHPARPPRSGRRRRPGPRTGWRAPSGPRPLRPHPPRWRRAAAGRGRPTAQDGRADRAEQHDRRQQPRRGHPSEGIGRRGVRQLGCRIPAHPRRLHSRRRQHQRVAVTNSVLEQRLRGVHGIRGGCAQPPGPCGNAAAHPVDQLADPGQQHGEAPPPAGSGRRTRRRRAPPPGTCRSRGPWAPTVTSPGHPGRPSSTTELRPPTGVP
jgi:hypothetical protein